MSVLNCQGTSNMKSLFGFALLLTAAVASSDALSCACSNCTQGTCTGDICYSKIIISEIIMPSEPDGHSQGCYFQAQAHLCNRSSAWHSVRCCEGHLCNQDLQATLPEPATPSASSLSPPSSGSCYKSDSSRGPTIHLCSLENYCYSTLRRRTDGTVVHRRGCTNSPCVNETRNRKIKRCCTDSLCNSLIEDPLQEQGGSGTATPTSSIQTTPPQSPPTATPSQTVTPLTTYSPPSLVPKVTHPTNAPPTTPPNNPSAITCHCDFGGCDSMGTCKTDVACATLYRYSSYSMQEIVSVSKFCLNSAMGCGSTIGMDFLACCNGSYCNNFEAPPPTTARPTRETVEWTTDGGFVSMSQTTPTSPVSRPNYDIYYIVGIGVFVVAGIVLIIVVMAIICYCCWTRYGASKRPTKKAISTDSVGGVESAVGSSLSFPSPNIYTKRRESSSVSTDATSSSRPISAEIPRTSYSSTSV